jgi:hypothetical protein
MESLASQLVSLAVFLLAVSSALFGLLWLLWMVAKVFKLGCFHPLAKRET